MGNEQDRDYVLLQTCVNNSPVENRFHCISLYLCKQKSSTLLTELLSVVETGLYSSSETKAIISHLKTNK